MGILIYKTLIKYSLQVQIFEYTIWKRWHCEVGLRLRSWVMKNRNLKFSKLFRSNGIIPTNHRRHAHTLISTNSNKSTRKPIHNKTINFDPKNLTQIHINKKGRKEERKIETFHDQWEDKEIYWEKHGIRKVDTGRNFLERSALPWSQNQRRIPSSALSKPIRKCSNSRYRRSIDT